MDIHSEFNDDLNGIPTMDLHEIKIFSIKNSLFAFVRAIDEKNYYLHYITATGYQFALSTQRRSDRPYQIRLFATIGSAIKTARKCNVLSITSLSDSAKFAVIDNHLIICN